MIYLDNNATTQVATECMDAMLACMQNGWGNPSSKHKNGFESKHFVSEARARVAAMIGAAQPEIVFTSGATESSHTAILGALALNPDKRHVICSTVEHPSILLLLKQLEAQGIRVTYLPVDRQGNMDLSMLDAAISPDTALVSIMWANNETGVLFPVEEAAHLTKSKGCLFHTDAVQAVGKTAIDLSRIPADLMSLSGHKLHAAKGVGALFVRKGIKLPPLFPGHQERARRGGTENVPGIAGLGAVSELAASAVSTHGMRIKSMRDRLEAGILASIPFASINGAGAERVGNTSNIRFGNMESEIILDRLDRMDIFASPGAACTAGGTEPSHVLTAMGLDRSAALASIRFSLSRYTTDEEIDQVLAELPGIVGSMNAEAA